MTSNMAPTEGEETAAQGTNNVVKFREPKPNEDREKARQSAKQKRASFRDSRISQTSTDVYHGKKHAGTYFIKKTNMNDELEDFDNKYSNIFGIVQIVLGILCIILGIVAIVIKCTGAFVAVGIWGGLVILASGVTGVIAYRSPIVRLVITCFALALIAFVIGGLIFIIMCFFLSTDISKKKEYTKTANFWGPDTTSYESSKKLADDMVGKIVVDCILLLLGLAAMVSAAIQAVLAGKVFIIRGPLEDETTNPSAATPLRNMGAADDGWGEYNPQPKQRSSDQEWGEYKPKKRTSSRTSREHKPEEQPTTSTEEKEKPPSQDTAAASDVKIEVDAATDDRPKGELRQVEV